MSGREKNWGEKLAESFLSRPEEEQREMLQSARDAVVRAQKAGAKPAVIIGSARDMLSKPVTTYSVRVEVTVKNEGFGSSEQALDLERDDSAEFAMSA